VDDLKGLSALWETMNLPAPELEKRLTEFQVAETEDGQVVGAIALQITGRQGRLHSEAFKDFTHADNLRHLLWERIQNIANNHGLTRLWIKDTAPFWDHNGFRAANDEAFQKLPTVWDGMRIGARTLQLKDETETLPISLDKEFALFMQSEKDRTEKMFRQARTMKMIALLVAIMLLGMVIAIGAYFLFRKVPR
jgi:hypothetical protein